MILRYTPSRDDGAQYGDEDHATTQHCGRQVSYAFLQFVLLTRLRSLNKLSRLSLSPIRTQRYNSGDQRLQRAFWEMQFQRLLAAFASALRDVTQFQQSQLPQLADITRGI